MASQSDVPLSMASCSFKFSKHTLPQKIEAIAQAGFKGIEMALQDVVSFTSSHQGREVGSTDYDALCDGAAQIAKLCEANGVKITLLHFFGSFEGYPEGSPEREEAFASARGWIRIMEALGTDTIEIGSSIEDNITSSVREQARDLADLADMLAQKGFRLTYENRCWATNAPKWKDIWAIAQAADRPNIGLCLNTFQTAGSEWADPTTESGHIESGGISKAELDKRFRTSLQELTSTIPRDKIFNFRISDAYRMSPPLKNEQATTGVRPRAEWSHSHRPLPYDGGYLPIASVAEAVLATGYRGWTCVEVFEGQFQKKYGDDLHKFTRQAKNGCVKLLKCIK
ncbi:related to dehydroshikimate dehydratase [Cephalotrichum gorgonifer]|uniref:Related to dehydroshikimate dehydratase n=1 Tax=Cephalotrichum gorgonifer TaxID=2041049 RepID=A0AAE8SZK2_9PEZI|nr:related to dehydroshikimate dehydratase [Cephalotrichum gorgonifer]